MEMIGRSGGKSEFLRVLSPYTSRARIAQLILFTLGVMTFFDPLVSILLVGSVFGSVLDGFPISVEKMAFLVDITALPVASIIPGSTWFIWVNSFLPSVIEDLGDQNALAASIRYQFYPVLMLALAFLQLILSRESGPILKSENEKRAGYGKSDQALETALSTLRREATKPERSINWWLPVLIFNIILWVAFVRFGSNILAEREGDGSYLFSAWMTCTAGTIFLVQLLFFSQSVELPSYNVTKCWRTERPRLAFLTDTFPSGSASKSDDAGQLIDQDFGDIIGSPKTEPVSIPRESEQDENHHTCFCHWSERPVVTLADGIESMTAGISKSMFTLVALSLTWATSRVYLDLGIDRIVLGWVLTDDLSTEALPIVTFLGTLMLSLVLGSPWTSVSIVLPIISYSFVDTSDMDSDGMGLIIGCILSGAVAGGQIGPFSDTTILSSFATSCDVRRHFVTQIPYTLPVLCLSMLAGILPVSFGAFPEFFVFFIGFVVICIFVIVVCRRVEKPRFLPGRSGDAITKDLHPLQRGIGGSSNHKYLPDGLIMPVNTDDLIDREEEHTMVPKENQAIKTMCATSIPVIRTHTLQSFKSKLKEVNSSGSDPILGLVADGLLPDDIKETLKGNPNKMSGVLNQGIEGDQNTNSKRSTFENKKRLIEATIKSSEKDGNIFSESLRLFLRTAETKLDQIMSESSLDIQASLQASQSAESGDDDSLDNLMMDIAAKGWKSAADEAVRGDDGDTEATGTGEGYTTGGGYTTDGVGSEAEESDDSVSASSSSSTGEDGQSTAFTTEHEDSDSNGENTSTGTSNGPSLSASEGTPGINSRGVDPSVLMNPLAFHKTHNVFAWMGGPQVSTDETETDHESTKDYTKASF